MVLRFVSDNIDNMLGFMIQYESDTVGETVRMGGCGGMLTTERGILTSPSFPNDYPGGQSCIYAISVSVGRFITITFSLLDIKCNEDMGSDLIEIRDGGFGNSPLIIKDCSEENRIPMAMQSTHNLLWIK